MADITDKTVKTSKGSEVGGATYTKFYAYAEIIATEETSTKVRLSVKTYVYLTGSGMSGTTISYSGSLYSGTKTFTCGSSAATYGSTTKDIGWVSRGSSTGTYTVKAYYTGGSGTTYTSTASVSYTVPTSAISLSTYTVSYNANSGSGAPSSQTKWQGETLTLSSTKPTRTGYTFLGWSTSSTATSATYSAGGSYTANAAATLYAVWASNSVCTITFNANGGDDNLPDAVTYTVGTTITLSTTTPSRSGYVFSGWSTSSTATSATYSAGGSYKNSSAADGNVIILYAVWTSATCTINYDANGGTNAPSSQTHYGGAETTLSPFIPYKEGYYFVGWATSSFTSNAEYAREDAYSNTDFTQGDTITLYAVYRKAIDGILINVPENQEVEAIYYMMDDTTLLDSEGNVLLDNDDNTLITV